MHASTEGVASLAVGGVAQRFRWIPPGEFQMGSPEDEDGRYDDEGPRHRVAITRGFWLGETPVTQALWTAVMGTNPSLFQSPDRPVEQVSWRDCQEIIARLGEMAPGQWRLPTEAEWEYACRAGTTGPTYAPLDAVAWHEGNSGGETHPVGQLARNPFGLYDMLGNAWEWCADWHGGYSPGDLRDPTGPVAGALRVFRGGSWVSTARYVRAASRSGNAPGVRDVNLGFRLARSPGTGEWAEPGTRSGPEPVEGHPRTKGDTMHARSDTHALAHPLIAALEAADLEVEPYSGRGMYGRTCASVCADPWEVAAAAVEGATEETREEIAEALRATQTDSLGLGTVCYWPRLAAPDSEAGQ